MASNPEISFASGAQAGPQRDPLIELYRSVAGATRIVNLGAGTGGSMVTEGVCSEPYTGLGVTAVVSPFDDGGGTGKLRRHFGLPAVGDVRQNLRAMSNLLPETLDMLESRFAEGRTSDELNLKGQPAGNLVIARAVQYALAHGGTFTSALTTLGDLYQVKGSVLPVSNDIRNLRFNLPDGRVINGEHNMEKAKDVWSLRGTDISFVNPETNRLKQATISEEVEAAIEEADMVVLAPGDLYTSIGPNLVVRGMKEALLRARVVVMISNLMNKGWHTGDFTTYDYVKEYERLIGARVIERVIINEETLNETALADQAKDGSHPVEADLEALEKDGYTVRAYSLLSHELVKKDLNDELVRSEIRHNSGKVASALQGVYSLNGFASNSRR